MKPVNKILKPKRHLLIFYKIKKLWKSDYFWFRVKFTLLFPFVWNSRKVRVILLERYYAATAAMMIGAVWEDKEIHANS